MDRYGSTYFKSGILGAKAKDFPEKAKYAGLNKALCGSYHTNTPHTSKMVLRSAIFTVAYLRGARGAHAPGATLGGR